MFLVSSPIYNTFVRSSLIIRHHISSHITLRVSEHTVQVCVCVLSINLFFGFTSSMSICDLCIGTSLMQRQIVSIFLPDASFLWCISTFGVSYEKKKVKRKKNEHVERLEIFSQLVSSMCGNNERNEAKEDFLNNNRSEMVYGTLPSEIK